MNILNKKEIIVLVCQASKIQKLKSIIEEIIVNISFFKEFRL